MNRAPHTYDVKRADALTADERDAWRAMTRARSSLWSPYFQIEFIDQMQAVSDRVRVVVVREAGAPVAFLPFLCVVAGFAQPVSGQICDTHGLIASDPAAIDVPTLAAAAKISFYSFHGVPDDQTGFAPYVRYRYEAFAADLSGGYDAFHERVSEGGTRPSFKKQTRKTRNLERDYGPMRFELNDRSEAAFQQMLALKSAQYRRSRHFDVFSARWTIDLLRRLWADQTGPLQGQLSTLYVGDRLVTAHFGMKGERVANDWFPVYDQEFYKYSPGLILIEMMYRAWVNEGVLRVDRGGGETEAKLQFTDLRLPMMGGLVRRSTLAAQTYRGFGALCDVVAKTPNDFVAKLPHRISAKIRSQLLYGLV